MRGATVILLILLSAMANGAHAQKVIELHDHPLKVDLNSFYIKKVIDGRYHADSIGFVKLGLFNREEKAVLAGPLDEVLERFLRQNLASDSFTTPLTMKVIHLEVSERVEGGSEFGRAELEVEFYRSSDAGLGKVHEVGLYVEETSFDVTRRHGHRIREVLEDCLTHLNASDWRSQDITFQSPDSVVAEKVAYQESDSAKNAKQDRPWRSLFMGRSYLGSAATGIGLTYYGFTEKEGNDWIFPFMLSFERFQLREEVFERFAYQGARLNLMMPGVSCFRKLGEQLHAQLIWQVPLGSETLLRNFGREQSRFILGVAASQGLYFIPKSQFGLAFGVGVYERFTTSKAYPSDLGVRAEVGFKF